MPSSGSSRQSHPQLIETSASKRSRKISLSRMFRIHCCSHTTSSIRPAYSLISSGTETASLHQEGIVAELRHNPSHLQKIAAAWVAGTGADIRGSEGEIQRYAVLGYSGAGSSRRCIRPSTDIEPGQLVAFGGEGSGHGETVVAGRNLVVPVPDGVPLEQARFATLGSIAMHAVRTANIGLGETVAVIGLGIVGQLVAQLARLQGGGVVAIDLRPERIELARRARRGACASRRAAAAEIRAQTGGRGADCVIVAAAANRRRRASRRSRSARTVAAW